MEKVMKKMLRVLVALMPLLVFSCSDEENIVENASASIRWIRPEVEFRAVSASPAQGQRRVVEQGRPNRRVERYCARGVVRHGSSQRRC